MSNIVRLSWLRRPPRRLRLWAVGAGLLTLAAGAALWLSGRGPSPPAPGLPVEDPRLTFPTPFRNVRPDVRYVGSQRCAACHTQADTYRHHPMARSFARLAPPGGPAHRDKGASPLFVRGRFRFRVQDRHQRTIHSVTRLTADGKDLDGLAREVTFAIGSGTHGRSYLVNLEGRLFQSPITWFPEAGRRDLSPGYAVTTLFDRPIKPSCLFCHAGTARPVEDSINQFHAPASLAAIGCERCHGPGELHARARDAGPPAHLPDDTIVNPVRLAPSLRDAVCEQCHLEGEARVLRRGRQVFDYRPSLPLQLFWSVFVRPPELSDDFKFVGHVEQMRASACARKSGGRLGCISCHDPHRKPDPGERIGYFRDRCLQCHEHQPCRRRPPPPHDPSLRAHQERDCIACHMPRRSNTEIVHTTVSDHRILRRPGGGGQRTAARPSVGPAPLIPFHQRPADGRDAEQGRDLGLAIIDTASRQRLPPWARRQVGKLAQPLLDEAVGQAPDDLSALEARGLALAMQGWPREALADFAGVLSGAPRREVSLAAAADMAAMLGQYGAARDYWRRAIEVNPWMARYHARLAAVLAQSGDWPTALVECRAALRLNPAGDLRKLLITCLLRSGDRAAAEVEFRRLIEEDPGATTALRQWWATQVR